MATATIPEYIARIKNFTVNVSKVDVNALKPFDERSEKMAMDAAAAAYSTNPDPRAKFSAANQLTSQLAKLQNSVTITTERLAALTSNSYPGQLTVRIRLQAMAAKLTAGRAPTSVAMVEARDILLGIREDIELILKNGTVPPDVLLQMLTPPIVIPEGRQGDNHKAVLSGLEPTRLIVQTAPRPAPVAAVEAAPAPVPAEMGVEDPDLSLLPANPDDSQMRGGSQSGGADSTTVFNALRTRKIRLLPMGSDEATSSMNTYVRGDEYVDESLNVYTVVDEYIITKEDIPTFQLLEGGDDPKMKYIQFRSLLLQFDTLRQKYERYIDSYYESATPYSSPNGNVDGEKVFNESEADAPGTQLYEDKKRIWETLLDINGKSGAIPLSDVFPGDAKTKTAFKECRDWFIVNTPKIDTPVDPEDAARSANEQKIYRFSDYYANIVLSTVAARPAGAPITAVVNGVQILTPEGDGLNRYLRDAITFQNDEGSPINRETMNQQVIEALRAWLTSQRPGVPSDPLLNEVALRLRTATGDAAAQKSRPVTPKTKPIGPKAALVKNPTGGRTHRRRLPKLI